jgi:peptidyl-dipeptidase Dcp
MHAHGGLNRANGDALRRSVLSRGRTAEPLELFQSFYGRGPEIGPLLEYHGIGGS